MEFANSWSSFFYNIIPGFIFLFVNSLYFRRVSNVIFRSSSGAMEVLQVVVISIFLGFVFQSLTKILREYCLNQRVITQIEDKDKILLERLKGMLRPVYGRNEKNLERIEQQIYLIHNYLVANHKILLPEFFSPRLALWSNMFFATLITILIILISHPRPLFGNIILDLFLLVLFTCHSYKMSERYLFALFDSIIRTFISARSLFISPKSNG